MSVTGQSAEHAYQPGSAMAAEAMPGVEFGDSADLRVTWYEAASGAETVLSEGVHYTIGGDGSAATGTITALDTYEADDWWFIERATPLQQPYQFSTVRVPPPNWVEAALDRLTRAMQEVGARVERTVMVPLGEVSRVIGRAADRAGLFAVWDADGNLTSASGTGSDAALRTDLAATGGSALVGWVRALTGAVSRSLSAILGERALRVTDFGADPTGATDCLAAHNLARTAALASGKALIYPQGAYKFSSTPNFGGSRLTVRGEGTAVIIADFDGQAVMNIDAGVGDFWYDCHVSGFVLYGNGSADQDGLYVRNCPQGSRRDIYVRNVTRNAFNLADVESTWERCSCSYRAQGAGGEAVPLRGLHLGSSADISATSACTFKDGIFHEPTEQGVYLDQASNNKFINVVAEGLSGWGMYIGPNCYNNSFDTSYCELNELGDFDIHGFRNSFVNCSAYDLEQTTRGFLLRSSSYENRIELAGSTSGATTLTTIEIEVGAENNIVRDSVLYRLIDSGTGSICENYSDAFNGKTREMTRFSANGLIDAADDAAAAAAGVPIGYLYRTGGTPKIRVS